MSMILYSYRLYSCVFPINGFLPRDAYATHIHSAVYAMVQPVCLSVCHALVLKTVLEISEIRA